MLIYLLIYFSLNTVERINIINPYKNVTGTAIRTVCINLKLCNKLQPNQAWILDEVVCRLSTAFSVRNLTAIAQSIAISNMRYDEINALITTNPPIRTEHLLRF